MKARAATHNEALFDAGEAVEERSRWPIIAGKLVRVPAWELTAQILAEWNVQTDRHWRLLTSAGAPSEAAKRIYGRVVAYPDLDLATHADIMRRTLASKWWGHGPPTIGVVYGPKVFEDNIDRPASTTTELSARRARRHAARRSLVDGGSAA